MSLSIYHPSVKVLRIGLISIFVLCMTIKCGVAQPNRQENKPATRFWVDSTGKFRIQATLKSRTETEVALMTADGRVITVPIHKLSKADQKFLTTITKATEARPAANSWKLVADSIELPNGEVFDRVIQLPNVGKTDGTGTMVLDRSNGRAVVGFLYGRQSSAKFYSCNLHTGAVQGPATVDDAIEPLAVHGDMMIARKLSGVFKDTISIWRFTDANLELTHRWKPHATGDSKKRGPHWAKFVDQEHLLTFNGLGQLAFWKAGTNAPLYEIDSRIHNKSFPAISPGGKYVATILAVKSVFLLRKMVSFWNGFLCMHFTARQLLFLTMELCW